jgi:hypothetical protein
MPEEENPANQNPSSWRQILRARVVHVAVFDYDLLFFFGLLCGLFCLSGCVAPGIGYFGLFHSTVFFYFLKGGGKMGWPVKVIYYAFALSALVWLTVAYWKGR